jgi:hypothetical protein
MTRKTLAYSLLIGGTAGLIDLMGRAFPDSPRKYFHIAATALVAIGSGTLIYLRDRKQERGTSLPKPLV